MSYTLEQLWTILVQMFSNIPEDVGKNVIIAASILAALAIIYTILIMWIPLHILKIRSETERTNKLLKEILSELHKRNNSVDSIVDDIKEDNA